MNPLRSLDEQVLPALARRLRRAIDSASHRGAESSPTAPAPPAQQALPTPPPTPLPTPAPLKPAAAPRPATVSLDAVRVTPPTARKVPRVARQPTAPPPRLPTVSPPPPPPPAVPLPPLLPSEPVAPVSRQPRAAAAARPAAVRARREAQPGTLARLDARLAHRGILRVVADLPQLGLLVVGLLLVAGAVAAIEVTGDGGSDGSSTNGTTTVATACPVGRAAGSAFVGPLGDTALSTYITQQDRNLTACARSSAASRLLAVVSFHDAESPAAASQDLRGVSVGQVFAQLPANPASPRVLPVTGPQDGSTQLEASIDDAYDAAQQAFLADRSAQLMFADSVTAATPLDVAGKADAQATAAKDALQAAQLRLRCACIYGAVVSGRVADLQALRTSAVRVIALAPAGTTAGGLTARPLLPTERGALGAAAAPTPVVAGSIG